MYNHLQSSTRFAFIYVILSAFECVRSKKGGSSLGRHVMNVVRVMEMIDSFVDLTVIAPGCRYFRGSLFR